MKAAIVDAPGESARYGDFAEPVVSDGYELVELVASGLHPIVRALAEGRHYGSSGSWPMIPGIDAVARTPAGELIYTGLIKPPYGTFAQRMAAPKMLRFALPAGADPVAIAAGINPGLSSWLPLRAHANEGALGTVLVLGVTGVAGLLAVQNARALGAARVVGAGRNPLALQRAAELGATIVTLTGDRGADANALRNALGGAAPSIVLDYLWASAAEATFEALGKRGFGEESGDIAYVQIGDAAGPNASVPASLLRSRRIRLSGSGAGSAVMSELMRQVPIYMHRIAEREVEVPTQTFALERVGQAWTEKNPEPRRVVIVAAP